MQKDFFFYFSFYVRYKRGLLLSLLLSLTQALSLFPIAFIIKYLFDQVLLKGELSSFVLALGGIVILSAINSLLILANSTIALKMIKNTVCLIRGELLQQILFLNTSYYTHQDLDKIHSQIVQDTERLDDMTAALLTQFLPSIFIVGGLSIVLIYINFQLFLVVSFCLPFLYFIGKSIGRRVKIGVSLFHEDFSKFSKGVSFVLKFNELIKLSSNEEQELVRQKILLSNLEKSSRKVAWINTAYNTIQGNIFVVSGVLVLLFGGYQVINDYITAGSLLSFYVLLNIISSYLKKMVGVVPKMIEGQASLAAIMAILRNEEKEVSAKKAVSFQNQIILRDVDFAFGDRLILKNFNLEISKHSTVGIFGPSGTGKSTLIKLILGIYRVEKGLILVDEIKLNELNLFVYRKQFGVLPQEPLFFPGTIHENLIYGIENSDFNEVMEICKKCCIHQFILSLPNGYHSDIGNSGKKISGGQKQRIAIARALLRKPEILILDELDNHLDEETTLEIIKNIKAMKITTIVISHNSFILPYVDQSVLLG
ncbi:MAG: ABC-type bacteriocin/lantibiotic exporter with double-glycine peptidase domain [Cyclobacteriaceae bacterium]